MRIFFLLMLVAGQAQAECFDWSEAGKIIRGNNLRTHPKRDFSLREFRVHPKVRVDSLFLCQENGRYFFEVLTVDENNRAQFVIIDAKTGYRQGE